MSCWGLRFGLAFSHALVLHEFFNKQEDVKTQGSDVWRVLLSSTDALGVLGNMDLCRCPFDSRHFQY